MSSSSTYKCFNIKCNLAAMDPIEDTEFLRLDMDCSTLQTDKNVWFKGKEDVVAHVSTYSKYKFNRSDGREVTIDMDMVEEGVWTFNATFIDYHYYVRVHDVVLLNKE